MKNHKLSHIYWFHPVDYWLYMVFTERVNLQIMRAFEAEGIEFAFPTTTNYLAHDSHRQRRISISGDSGLTEQDTGQWPVLMRCRPNPCT